MPFLLYPIYKRKPLSSGKIIVFHSIRPNIAIQNKKRLFVDSCASHLRIRLKPGTRPRALVPKQKITSDIINPIIALVAVVHPFCFLRTELVLAYCILLKGKDIVSEALLL